MTGWSPIGKRLLGTDVRVSLDLVSAVSVALRQMPTGSRSIAGRPGTCTDASGYTAIPGRIVLRIAGHLIQRDRNRISVVGHAGSRRAMRVASATPTITISTTLRKHGARCTECNNGPAGQSKLQRGFHDTSPASSTRTGRVETECATNDKHARSGIAQTADSTRIRWTFDQHRFLVCRYAQMYDREMAPSMMRTP